MQEMVLVEFMEGASGGATGRYCWEAGRQGRYANRFAAPIGKSSRDIMAGNEVNLIEVARATQSIKRSTINLFFSFYFSLI